MDQNSVVIVTGANSGMGKATSLELAKTGATIVMLCRSQKRGKEAYHEVKSISQNPNVHLMLCNLGSRSDIIRFCNDFKNKYDHLDVLINNAGVIVPGRHETVDGFELQFGVNHLGHFLLTNLLINHMKKSPAARIINVSSGAHKIGKIHFNDVNLKRNYKLWRAYGQSKLANILFTYELSRRLEGTNITVNCLHPGAVATNMGINRETGFGTFITKCLKPFFQTPEKGAETTIYLAKSNEVKKVTGKYFYKKKDIASSKRSYDEDVAQKLWDLSVDMTQLNECYK